MRPTDFNPARDTPAPKARPGDIAFNGVFHTEQFILKPPHYRKLLVALARMEQTGESWDRVLEVLAKYNQRYKRSYPSSQLILLYQNHYGDVDALERLAEFDRVYPQHKPGARLKK